jgi:hypothetical protein
MTAGIGHQGNTIPNRAEELIVEVPRAVTEEEIEPGIMDPRPVLITGVEAPNTSMAGARGTRALRTATSAGLATMQTVFHLSGLVHLLVKLVRPKRTQRLPQKNELHAWPL